VLRVTLTLALGYFFALPLPPMLGIDRRWGVAGLTLSAGIAGWIEFVLLRSALHTRIGAVPYSATRVLKMWMAALVAAAAGYAIQTALRGRSPLLAGPCVLVPYGAIYLVLTHWLGVSMMQGAWRRLRRLW
jgi:putative peptidoglycan lipid II flippase